MNPIVDAMTKIISYSLDIMTVWFFCCLISVFILPSIIDRIIFYIPKLISLSKNGEVYKKSIAITIMEGIVWLIVIGALFVFLGLYTPGLLLMTTNNLSVIILWFICLLILIVRYANFDKKVKKEFYYKYYMKYIKPEALNEYEQFIDDLDDLEISEIEGLLDTPLPYMHRQSALRKLKEINMH